MFFFFIATPSNSLLISYTTVCLDVCQSLSLFFLFLTSVHCGMLSVFLQINKSGPMWSVCFQHLLYHLDAQHCTAANPPSPLIHLTTPLHLQSFYLQPRINTTVSADKQHNPTWFAEVFKKCKVKDKRLEFFFMRHTERVFRCQLQPDQTETTKEMLKHRQVPLM